MPARRPQLAELGLFLLFVVLPLIFTPFSASPFGDPKLVVLVAGTLCLWGAGVYVDRRIAVAAGAWVGLTFLATVLGVNPIRSLTAQTEGQGGGLLLTACCAVLITVATGLPKDLIERGRRWLVATGCVMAILGLSVKLAPDLIRAVLPQSMTFIGTTAGNQLFAAAFMATTIAAEIGARPTSLRRQLILLAILAFGTASFGERSSLILPIVAVVATLSRSRLPARRVVALGGTVLAILLIWQVLEPLAPEQKKEAGAALAPITGQATDQARQVVWGVMFRGWEEKPSLGWGPGNSDAAFLTEATPQQIEAAARDWRDAHNLLLETATTTGVVGLSALLVLLGLATLRAVKCPPARAWALGGAVALGAYSMVEPLNLMLTPLLFVFLGVAYQRGSALVSEDESEGSYPSVGVFASVAVVMSLALGISLVMIAGATLERWGRTYGEEWALRAALRVQPWRLSSTEHLALQLAAQGRAGDQDAGAEAKRIIAEGVERFPWDVNVRLWAADVDTLLNDPAGSRAWRRQHVERFPADETVLTDDAPDDGFTLPGEEPVTGG